MNSIGSGAFAGRRQVDSHDSWSVPSLHSARKLPVGQWNIGTAPNPRLIQRARLKKKDFLLRIRFFSYRPSAGDALSRNFLSIPSTTYSLQFQTPAPAPAIPGR